MHINGEKLGKLGKSNLKRKTNMKDSEQQVINSVSNNDTGPEWQFLDRYV